MAEETQESTQDKSTGLLPKLAVWAIVFSLGVGTGVAVPFLLLPSQTRAASNRSEMDSGQMDIPPANDKPAYIGFEEVVVNLNDARFSRYLNCRFSLQVADSQLLAIQKLVDAKSVVLKNWVIAHLRDKKPEDVGGKLGHNTLRREIRDRFNEILFSDGIERVQDVLFQDLKVQ